MHKLLEQYKHDDFRTVPELILLKMCYTDRVSDVKQELKETICVDL